VSFQNFSFEEYEASLQNGESVAEGLYCFYNHFYYESSDSVMTDVEVKKNEEKKH
jgi:hypothetical protein